MNIEMRDIGTIKPYPNNPRANDKTVRALVKAFAKYGFNVPLVLDKKGVIVCGHARYAAAQEAGLKEVPVVVAEHLTPKQAKKYRLADNKIAERSKWDESMLIPEIREIGNFADVPGFTQQDIQLYSGLFQETRVPTFTAPVRRPALPGGAGLPQRREVPGSGIIVETQRRTGSGVVTRQNVEQAQHFASTKFERNDAVFQSGMIPVRCRHCGETFKVLQKDLERL